MNLHPTALIDPAARLAADVCVGPYAVIGPDVVVGEGCVLGPHVTIHAHVSLGARCRVHANAVLGDLPQDLAFKDVLSRVEIGSDCVIREGVTIHRGTKEGTMTKVGDGCMLMVNAHVAHNVRLGDKVILANGVLLAGYVEVGDRAFISGNAVVHQFTRIGRLCMMSGGSGVSKDIPPFCTTAGVSRNRVAGLNVIGLRRSGFTAVERLAVKRAFQLVYRSGLNTKQALAALRSEIDSGPAAEWADFIAASKRGICGSGGDDGEESGD